MDHIADRYTRALERGCQLPKLARERRRVTASLHPRKQISSAPNGNGSMCSSPDFLRHLITRILLGLGEAMHLFEPGPLTRW
jgi:hypothetical protein